MHVSKMVGAYALVAIYCACGSVDKPASPDAPRGVDAAPDVMQQPFTPSQLNGLVLWLDANQSVVTSQNKVSTWMDLSGRNNNAGQAVADLQPTLVTGVINGLPVIRFGNTFLQVTDSTTLQWATDDFAIVVVAGYKNTTTSGAGYGTFVAKQETAYPYAGPGLWGNYTAPSPDTVIGLQTDSSGAQYAISTAAKNDGVIRLYSGRRVGKTLDIRINGTVLGSAPTTTLVNVSAPGRPLFIGGTPNTGAESQALDGDIAELIAVHGNVSNVDLAKLETYLKAKYGLP